MKRPYLFVGITLAMLVVDQLVKVWVRGAIPQHGSMGGRPFPGFFEITLQYNEGIAFGFFQKKGLFLSPVAIAIAIGATWYSFKHPKEPILTHVSMGLLASGAIGNLYDRVVNGRVTDMFYFRAISFPVFNVADSCITIATILLIFSWFGDATRHGKKESTALTKEPPALTVETPAPGTE